MVTIYYDPEQQRPSFMSDQTEERCDLEEGKSVGFKGFILTWFDMIDMIDMMDRSFLVVGHTARIGTEENQLALSVERAKMIWIT